MHVLGSLRLRLALGSALAAGALAVAWWWAFEVPLEQAIVLAPALVVGVGLLAIVAVLLARAALESIRASGHPRLVLATIGALIALGIVLTILGVELPSESP